jgi:hypothetical protein
MKLIYYQLTFIIIHVLLFNVKWFFRNLSIFALGQKYNNKIKSPSKDFFNSNGYLSILSYRQLLHLY